MDISALGLTQDELRNLVVNRIVDNFVGGMIDGDDPAHSFPDFERRIQSLIKDHVDAKFRELADSVVLPKLDERIENLVLQQTNGWGEKKGEPVTLTEYIVQRAEAYMQEPINFQGKTREQDSYNWKAAGPRIAYAVDRHIQYSIEAAMKQILADANNQLVSGIKGAVEAKLSELKGSLQVTAKIK